MIESERARRQDSMKQIWDEKRIVIFVRLLIQRYFHDEIGRAAAALTYYLLFSFFPLIIFVSGILSYSSLSPALIADELENLLPAVVIDLFAAYLQHINEAQSLQIVLFGLIFSFYFPMRAVSFIMRSVNRAYRIKEKEPVFRHYVSVFLYTLVVMGTFLSALFLLTFGSSLMTHFATSFRISPGFIRVWSSLRFLVLGLLLFLVLCLLYRLSARSLAPMRYNMPGALAALVSWMAISLGFSYYVENMANYSLLYGSIGAIIVLLLWLYFSAVTILMGAEFNHVLLMMRRGEYFE